MNDKSNPKSANAEAPDSVASQGQQDELYWLAFCYVAEELTAEETAAFELRLTDDLQAQETLAEVVSLSASAYQTIESHDENLKATSAARTADPLKSRPSKQAWRLIVAVAAGILVIGLAWQYLFGAGAGQNSVQQSVAVEAGSRDLSVGLGSIEIALWEQTVGMLHDDGAWHSTVKVQMYDESAEDDSAESAEGLHVDEDLVALFSSAISIIDISKGEM